MRTEKITEKNFSSSITCTAPWRLKKIIPLSNYQLQVEFLDGTIGVVDISRLVHSPTAGIFAPLKEKDLFNKVYIFLGTATWPGEIDLSPDAMYENIQKTGQWNVE